MKIKSLVKMLLILLIAGNGISYAEQWQTIDNYQVNEGLVKDSNTGLMWMRCSIGKTWDGSTCKGKEDAIDWEKAMLLPNKFEYAGYKDWRVPTKDELQSLVYCSSNQTSTDGHGKTACKGKFNRPTVNQKVFPNTPKIWAWTSLEAENDANSVWLVDFYNGYGSWGGKSYYYSVRLVRNDK